ncbi:hypothetical protein HG530_006447 [Fusarium avenaceum]|nr:hypothetical protein HG530_006447 [Fusarium avenaceum]
MRDEAQEKPDHQRLERVLLCKQLVCHDTKLARYQDVEGSGGDNADQADQDAELNLAVLLWNQEWKKDGKVGEISPPTSLLLESLCSLTFDVDNVIFGIAALRIFIGVIVV